MIHTHIILYYIYACMCMYMYVYVCVYIYIHIITYLCIQYMIWERSWMKHDWNQKHDLVDIPHSLCLNHIITIKIYYITIRSFMGWFPAKLEAHLFFVSVLALAWNTGLKSWKGHGLTACPCRSCLLRKTDRDSIGYPLVI